jgi:hypothetical protein
VAGGGREGGSRKKSVTERDRRGGVRYGVVAAKGLGGGGGAGGRGRL